jgi:hypothetical protein
MRFHIPPRDEFTMFGWQKTKPVTACYTVEFNYYEATSISRVRCPAKATALKFPPPPPRVTIPEGMDVIVEDVLAALPSHPVADDVRCKIAGRMPALPTNDDTGLPDLPPTVEVAVVGGDVGIALWEPDSRRCLLGVRRDSEVNAWSPSRILMEPGELTCDPETALLPSGTPSPH